MGDWQDKSDSEIDESVKSVLAGKHETETELDRMFLVSFMHTNYEYCNNPSYSFPIILDNKISIMNDGELWEASIDFDGKIEKHGTDEVLTKFYDHENPLRASMIVYLEINGVKP